MSSSPEQPVEGVGHEESNFNLRAYAWFLAAFILTAAAVHMIVWMLLGTFVRESPSSLSPFTGTTPPPEPRLQGSRVHPMTPAEDLARMREHEEQVLTRYAWVDRQAGIARIPISRAMDLVLKRRNEK